MGLSDILAKLDGEDESKAVLKETGETACPPNQCPVIDGVVPTDEIDQSPDLFDGDDEVLEMES